MERRVTTGAEERVVSASSSSEMSRLTVEVKYADAPGEKLMPRSKEPHTPRDSGPERIAKASRTEKMNRTKCL
ncbi:hypothetical protein LTR40_007642, partial [Exophiala xenobiotica]